MATPLWLLNSFPSNVSDDYLQERNIAIILKIFFGLAKEYNFLLS